MSAICSVSHIRILRTGVAEESSLEKKSYVMVLNRKKIIETDRLEISNVIDRRIISNGSTIENIH